MKGKTVVITGATAGIGLEAAKQLAARGARLILVGRSPEKSRAAVEALETATPDARVQVVLGDLGLHAEVVRIGTAIAANTKRIDVLVNNAGLFMPKFSQNADGIETTLAVNHLGYAHLTDLLLPALRETAEQHGEARIVSTASAAHLNASFKIDDMEMRQSYRGWTQYCNTKLLNILWTRHLANRLEDTGVTANCLHPGVIKTDLGRRSVFGNPLFKIFGASVAQGADTLVWFASSDEAAGLSGEYRARRKRTRLSGAAKDEALAVEVARRTAAYLHAPE